MKTKKDVNANIDLLVNWQVAYLCQIFSYYPAGRTKTKGLWIQSKLVSPLNVKLADDLSAKGHIQILKRVN